MDESQFLWGIPRGIGALCSHLYKQSMDYVTNVATPNQRKGGVLLAGIAAVGSVLGVRAMLSDDIAYIPSTDAEFISKYRDNKPAAGIPSVPNELPQRIHREFKTQDGTVRVTADYQISDGNVKLHRVLTLSSGKSYTIAVEDDLSNNTDTTPNYDKATAQEKTGAEGRAVDSDGNIGAIAIKVMGELESLVKKECSENEEFVQSVVDTMFPQ